MRVGELVNLRVLDLSSNFLTSIECGLPHELLTGVEGLHCLEHLHTLSLAENMLSPPRQRTFACFGVCCYCGYCRRRSLMFPELKCVSCRILLLLYHYMISRLYFGHDCFARVCHMITPLTLTLTKVDELWYVGSFFTIKTGF